MQNIFGVNQAPPQEGFGPIIPPDFGAPSQQEMYNQATVQSQQAPPQAQVDPYQRLMELYKPEGTYTKKLEDLIGQYPQEPVHSFKDKLLASIMGIGPGGMQRADYALHGGYQEDIQNWKNKVQPYEYLAGQERANNANLRYLATSALTNQYKYDKLDADTKYRNARLEIQRFKVEHPDWQLVNVRGGNIIAVNKQDPTQRVDTGIESGLLNDVDKLDMVQEDMIERIDAAGGWRVKAAEAGGWGLYNTPEGPVRINPRATGELPEGPVERVGTPSGSYASHTQEETRLHTRARQAYNTNPAWRKHIKFGPGQHDFSISTPGYFGPDEATYNAIKEYIYGGEQAPVKPPTSNRPSSTKPTKSTAPTTTPQTVNVTRGPDGKLR